MRFMPKGVQFEQKVVSLTRNRERPFRCTQCSTFFGSKLHFERYHLMHSNKRPKRYYMMHSNERPFFCPQCGKSFCIEYRLDRPMIIHTEMRPYPCMHCSMSFVQACNFCGIYCKGTVMYKSKTSRVKEIIGLCTECGFSIDCASQLQILHGMHTDERLYNCPQCRKAFPWSSVF